MPDGPPLDPGATKCPPIARPSAIPYDQIRANIAQAHDIYDGVMTSNPEGALPALFGFFIAQFAPGGAWDYKDLPQYRDGPEHDLARDFGNFNFGAILRSFGFSYYFTQNAAGAAQVGICAKTLLTGNGSGSCGVGVPGLVFPYQDQISDAVLIQNGYSYEKWIELHPCLM